MGFSLIDYNPKPLFFPFDETPFLLISSMHNKIISKRFLNFKDKNFYVLAASADALPCVTCAQSITEYVPSSA